MALFDGERDVREWKAAAYKPELAATLGSCMQDMMHCLKAGLEGLGFRVKKPKRHTGFLAGQM